MNTCRYCNSEIEEKTKAGKPRLYCNKSCARKFVTKNKPEVVAEANKRGYQTLKETKGDEFIAHRGRSTKAKREAAKKLNKEGHFSRMSLCADRSNRSKEHVENWKKSYEENGHMLSDPNWKQYSRKCRRITASKYGSAGDGYHWDHIVPLIVGFKEGISPEDICSEINIQKLTAEENLSKGHTLTEEAIQILESFGRH